MSSHSHIRGGASPSDLSVMQQVLYEMPWHALALVFRMLYGFRVEGFRRLPRQGPFILVLNEYSLIAMILSGWIGIVALKEAFRRNPEAIAFMREELFDFGFFRNAMNEKTPGRYAGLAPQTAGKLALGLLEGYRVLEKGGIVVMNPEGDSPWDGRPLPLGHSLAWLGLHTAAPIVPALVTIGAYDAWPRWQARLNLSGDVILRIGEPFRLCDSKRERFTPQEVTEAEALMQERFDALRYGQGGIAEWMGPPTHDGKDVAAALELLRSSTRRDNGTPKKGSLWRRGIALLLWRCPVCQSNDALLHENKLWGESLVRCQVCETQWRVRRRPGKDFRLKVTQGAPGLVGLEMALSSWYDEVKRDFEPSPISTDGFTLQANEQVLLETNAATLEARLPNPLAGDWTTGDAPHRPAANNDTRSGWGKLGTGRLLLTSERLVWQSPRGEIYFWWRHVTSLSLWVLNVLTVRYGAAVYRFQLGDETGLKWLTYAAHPARRAAAQTGAKLEVAAF